MAEIKVYNYGMWNGWTLNNFFVDFKYPCLKEFNLVDSSEEEADVIIFSHYTGIYKEVMTNPNNGDPLPFKNKNALWLFFSLENWGHPNMDKCDYAITSRSDFEHQRHACLPHCITYVEMWKDILLNKPKEVEEKPKFCSYMASNPIPFRQEFFDQLSQYKFVEAAGNCRTNVAKLPLGEDLKMNYIKDFKFNMAFENSCSPGYICEKHVQPMIVNSLPIYKGAPNVLKYFNTKSFLNWHDYNCSDVELLEAVKRADQDVGFFKSMWEQPWFVDNKIHYDISMKKAKDVFTQILRQVK